MGDQSALLVPGVLRLYPKSGCSDRSSAILQQHKYLKVIVTRNSVIWVTGALWVPIKVPLNETYL